MTPHPHIAILGAGPGGYVAAIRAAQLGARVTVVEKEQLGGVCLNWGCIPSKALLSVVELGDKLKKADELGLILQGAAAYDLARMVARKDKVVASLVKGIATLLKEWRIEHVIGQGTLKNELTLAVTKPDGSQVDIQADALVIATGSSWPNLPQFPIDGRRILTSQQMLALTQVPVSLLIVGGGVEGCEFASLYSALGTQVTVVEAQAHVLPLEDEDISSVMERELKKRGVTVMTGTTVESLEQLSDAVRARFKDGSAVSVEKLLVSVGRGFNSRGIGLEEAGVRIGTRGEIPVDDRMETNQPGIYAIGDVTGKAMLAHVASTQGQVAVENILGHRRTIRYDVIPAGIFTLPEIGRVGLTEQQAREQARMSGKNPDQSVNVGRFRYGGLGKAQATGDTTGFFKVIAEAATDKILGVHILGAHAADLIHEATLAMHVGATVAQVAGMIHAHPTLAEGLMEAMEDVRGSAIHAVRKKAGG
ncbi:dihydrolipoyl dehydrogenase [Candidatus Nitrospira nitrificans]|uniref:Dihydrolipoyl dehydrogenase n=1 Tax=Candidatus Nitrospira nitrificans TaxID=1742973 RepID=A0A0S4LNE5_9BACT|nr:dihydrolipoyl dehydrogenase [Candidatus Nitrospira nitrificans]CUS39052.1 Dihydrolipoyl dehydrogenase [Candidatus Nitrospira nitrificans]